MTETYSAIIPIPYNLKHEDLKLEPGAGEDSLRELLGFMYEMPDQSVERVFRATCCLHAAKAGSFTKCLETALIWEAG